jgi:hypothetical protein
MDAAMHEIYPDESVHCGYYRFKRLIYMQIIDAAESGKQS